MQFDIDACFKSSHPLIRGTIVKSFKYGSARETDPMLLEICALDLIKIVQDSDLNVKKNALESLNAIIHNCHSVIKSDIDNL